MIHLIANGLDDNGRQLKKGCYVVYCEEDCENNPEGAFGAIQCGEIAQFDGENFWGEFGEPLDADYAHRQI